MVHVNMSKRLSNIGKKYLCGTKKRATAKTNEAETEKKKGAMIVKITDTEGNQSEPVM